MTKRTYDRVMSAVLYASSIGLVVGLRARGWSDGPIFVAFLAFGCGWFVVLPVAHHFARPHLRYPVDLPAYVDRVVGYLAGEFDWDDQTQAIARRHLDNKDGYDPGQVLPHDRVLICQNPDGTEFVWSNAELLAVPTSLDWLEDR